MSQAKPSPPDRARVYEQEIFRQQARIAELEAHMQHLHKELDRQQGAKQQLKNLYVNVDGWVIRRLDARGYARKTRIKQVAFPRLDLRAASSDELLKIARTYDAKKYFQYHERREGMKLHYRLVSKAYRTTRNVSKGGLKKVYRLTRRGKG